ncbi:MAG TPA: hypothetical protein VHL34_13980 [Rhizomicrobium sp.]|jgi:hypothetical protein|nr:hypothetical protein [Rhizomicrobium sp.]
MTAAISPADIVAFWQGIGAEKGRVTRKNTYSWRPRAPVNAILTLKRFNSPDASGETAMLTMTADDMTKLAADLASEHGNDAADFARRAVATFELEGAWDRAAFWFTISVLLDDILELRLDPTAPITLH